MKLWVHRACLLAGLSAAWAMAWLAPGGAARAQTAGTPVWPAVINAGPPDQLRRADGGWEPVLVAPIRRADGEGDDAESTRPVAADGSPEPVAPVDGMMETPEPAESVDGLDPTVDTRSQEDIQAFNPTEPPAGYDPSQFTIDSDPALDRRPAELARLDPYVPIGVRIGSFVLFPEIEIAGAASSNVLRSATAARSDIALETRPAARLVSSWGRHALELGLKGTASFHNELPSEDDRAWSAEARGRLDVTRRTNLEATLLHDVSQESRGTINARAGSSGRTDIVTERAGLALNHRFNRLSLQLRGAVSERDYGPSPDNGGFIANDDRDTTQREAALRASWELKRDLSLFGEVAADDRSYAAASTSDGIRRDSSGERYRAGVSFGSDSRILRGEVSLGSARQHFDDGRLPELSGVIVDANVAWRVNGLTSVLFNARSDVGESTVAGSGGSLVRSGKVELRHAFRRHIVGTVGVGITRADYQGVDLVEQDLTALAGLEYHVSREVTLFGRYNHIDFTTTALGGDYTADEVRVGVRIRR